MMLELGAQPLCLLDDNKITKHQFKQTNKLNRMVILLKDGAFK